MYIFVFPGSTSHRQKKEEGGEGGISGGELCHQVCSKLGQVSKDSCEEETEAEEVHVVLEY